ncbi:methylthioribulose 1-phosphate dehydratase [Leptolyngbya sp. PCC 6406]|uniref:methylthioribulose 1-phosphate dehydratase n=1 Tax=Leptolyngbya sp. PCC 6406 TaxID=1173264 RepID=UPI0002ABC921|nr:methylthioribulose 1-phosphate dehydratase [Leptolyngbya sp. PCC 6406]
MLHNPDPRIALSWVIQDIHRRGWATGTGGNFSAVLGRYPLRLLMAPSGVDKGLVQPQDLIEVDAQAQVIGGSGKASAETLLHLAIVKERGAGAVLHTHSVFNTLLSMHYAPQGEIAIAGYEMLKGLEGVTTHNITVALPIVPNSQDMAEISQTVRALLQQPTPPYGILLAGHGLYTWGKTLFQARRHLEILEFLLELTYRKLTLIH